MTDVTPPRTDQMAQMFDAIAPRYDLLNRLLSAGIDQRWRSRVIEVLRPHAPARILDVATGTADIAIKAAALQPEKIVGVDIAENMLEVGREKIDRLGLSDLITLQKGDSARLPFSDGQFDAVTVAFGVRNFENLDEGLAEMLRVLKPGGRVVILEFSQPTVPPVKQLYGLYSRYLLPLVGRLISGHRSAYRYLPASAAAFPSGEKFLDHLRQVGYADVRCEPKTFGIASIYVGRRKAGGTPGPGP